jgi:uncharacterized membrane protein (GlpM family)
MPTIYRILIGCVLITIVAIVSDRSQALAGILATAPINIPIILWILWSKGNSEHIEDVTQSMLVGIVSTAGFIAACWYGFHRRWPFALTLAVGYLVWAAITFSPPLLRRLVGRI